MAPAGIAVTVETDVRAPLEATFRTIVPIELARIFRGLGPLPAVVGTSEQTGGWDHVGASHIVELSDGSQAHEQLMAYEPPRHFAYRVDGFTGPLRGLVSYADGAWWFSDADAGATHVRWMYVFAPRAARASVVRAVIAPLWSVYERRALSLAVSEAERTTGR
jgi:Polyketide cyclase / dehydrase and lipid transport